MLLSELRFGAFLSYSPRGDTPLMRDSRKWAFALKRDGLVGNPPRPMSQLVAESVRRRLADGPLGQVLPQQASLVPVPGSGLWRQGDLWVPAAVAACLQRVGIGAEVLPCLRRSVAVRGSHTAQSSDRPHAAEHYASFAVDRGFPAPTHLVLVDDVITRGATLLAAASRLIEAYPAAMATAFAVVRTISNPAEFESIYAPVVGSIAFDGEQTRRRP